MVDAEHEKELPNVLPNGNPFTPQIGYDFYRAVGACR
jgi:hypothetical protein